MDLTKDTYKITSIDAEGNVSVVFDCDGKTQKLAGVPLDSADATKEYMSNYLTAYKQGFVDTQVTVSSDVNALIGQKQTAEQE